MHPVCQLPPAMSDRTDRQVPWVAVGRLSLQLSSDRLYQRKTSLVYELTNVRTVPLDWLFPAPSAALVYTHLVRLNATRGVPGGTLTAPTLRRPQRAEAPRLWW